MDKYGDPVAMVDCWLIIKGFSSQPGNWKDQQDPSIMMDRFRVLGSDAFNAYHQINQTNAKRTTLTRNCFMAYPFFGLAGPL